MNLIATRVKKIVELYFPLENEWFINQLQAYGEHLAASSENGHTAASFERICLAILKLGSASKEEFVKALELAKLDFRDVLVNAGFGNSLTVHNEWVDRVLEGKDESR